MATMTAVQVAEPGGEFQIVERDIPDPAPGEVRIQVKACGICHSDEFVKQGTFPGLEFPRVPGHEVTGRIDAVGEGVDMWSEGDRVGVGWHGGHDFTCRACRDGDFVNCENGKVTGISFDGGYAEYMCAPSEAVARMPDDLDFDEAAPLLCAGITTFNALRNSGLTPGDRVAVQGVGGLGHLGIQYAANFGCEVIALSRGTDKKELAHNLGAHHYIDTTDGDPAEKLLALGGADVLLATAPNSQAITDVAGGLARDGVLMVVAATMEPIEISPMQLIMGRKSVQGWPSGSADDSEDTMNFSALNDVAPMVETFPLTEVTEAYDTMINNDARFRVVLVP